MKKTGIILILLMFIVCAIVGYQAAAVYIHPQSTATSESVRKESQKQQNLFLVHVDRLKSPAPVLKSVWVLFLYYSVTPSMTFVPLYQPETGLGSSLNLTKFSLTADGDISREFTRELQDRYEINSSDVIVLDDQALISFASRFPPRPPSSTPPVSGEQDAIENMCAFLNRLEAKEGVDLPWDEVLPDHFHTNIPFDLFVANWIQLTQSPNPPLCKIINGK